MKKYILFLFGLVISFPIDMSAQSSNVVDSLIITPQLLSLYKKAETLGNSLQIQTLIDSMRILAIRNNDKAGECLSYVLEMEYYKAIPDSAELWNSVEHLRLLSYKYGISNFYYYAYHEECAFLINQSQLYEARELLDNMFLDAISNGSSYGLYVCYLCAGHLYDIRDERNLAMESFEKAAQILSNNNFNQSPSTAYVLAAHSALLDLRFNKAYDFARMGLLETSSPQEKRTLLDIKSFCAFIQGNMSEFENNYYDYELVANTSTGIIETDLSPIVWRVIHEQECNEIEDFNHENVSAVLAKKYAYAYIGQYKKSLELLDSLYKYVIVNRDRHSAYDLNQRSAKLDNERLEFEKQKLELKNRLATRRLIIWMLSITLCFAFIFQYTINIRTRRHVRELKEANEIKDHFVQNMSHEIRTPLNSIIGFSQLLTMPDEIVSPQERLEYVDYIKNNSNMLLMLVNDVLCASDYESGNYEIKIENTLLEDVCYSSMKSVENRVPKGVKTSVVLDIPEGYIVRTDALRIQQLLVNLLTNACKNTQTGFIELRCSIKNTPGYVVFQVTDSGCGIPPAKATEIFDRFVKLDEFKQGSGMGLSICRNIAEKMNGRVFLDTSYTSGSRFVFEMKI